MKELFYLFIILFSALSLYFTQGVYDRAWLWTLPSIFLLFVFRTPSVSIKNRTKEIIIYTSLAFQILLLFSLIPWASSTHIVILAGTLAAAMMAAMALFFGFGGPRRAAVWFWICFGALALFYLLTPGLTALPVPEILNLEAAWDLYHSSTVGAEALSTGFDGRYLMVICHLLGTLLVYRLTDAEKKSSRTLLYLSLPFAPIFLQHEWSDAPAALLVLLLAYATRNKGRNLFLVTSSLFSVAYAYTLAKISQPTISQVVSMWMLNAITFRLTLFVLVLLFFMWWQTSWFSDRRLLKEKLSQLLFLFAFITAAILFPQNHQWLFITAIFSLWITQGKNTETSSEPISSPRLAFLISRIFILLSLPVPFSDIHYYFKVANKMAKGLWPYRDFAFEYPPLALITVYLPKVLVSELPAQSQYLLYRSLSRLGYFLIEVALFLVLENLYKRKRIRTSGMWVYVLGGAFFGQLLYDRLDILMGLSLVLAFYYLDLKKPGMAFLGVVAGVWIKLAPLILIPWFALKYIWLEKDRARLSQNLFRFSALFALPLSMIFLLFGPDIASFLSYHQARGVQAEALWASIQYGLHFILPEQIPQVFLVANFGASHLYKDFPILITLGTIVPVMAILGLYLFFGIKAARQAFAVQARFLFMVILTFITFNKVLSPQFMIWLICLYPFCQLQWNQRRHRVFTLALVIASAITSLNYYYYSDFVSLDAGLWSLMCLRNILLVAMTGILLWDLKLSTAEVNQSSVELDKPVLSTTNPPSALI